MKYRLKDRALQEKLDEISDGDFSKRLQDPAKSEKGLAVAYGNFLDGKGLQHLSLFLASEVEKVPEYDPHAWNEWPDVTPPKGVLLRIEVKGPDENLNSPEPRFGKVRERCCAKFDGQYWIRSNGLIVLLHGGETVRFRPWDDPREKENKE